MNIGVIANLAKPAAAATLGELARVAGELGATLVACDRQTARLAPGARFVTPARLAKAVDVAISLGGDGTVLQTVRTLDGAPTPLLGINLGNLGFLTGVPDAKATDALRAIVAGAYDIAVYPLLEARLLNATGRKRRLPARALNDIVLGWGASPRATMIELEVNHSPVASFVCDGMIVATPVGSTGHALSAGGPILHRDTATLLIEPICPHALGNRSVVIPNTDVIGLRIATPRKKLLLSIDGCTQGWIGGNDLIEIRTAPETVRFIHLSDYSWFRLLSQKLHWRGSSSDPK